MDLGWTDGDEAVAAELASLARARLYRRPIALAGFMGVGKSTLGLRLSELLQRPFYDTDTEVERRGGRAVRSYFPDQEPQFRKLEAEAVADLLARGPAVIALGGGALLDEASRVRLRNESLLVHLHVPWSELRAHIPDLIASRPLLEGKSVAQIHQLYLRRLQTYRQAALRITVDRKGAPAAAAIVLSALRGLEGSSPQESRASLVIRG